MFISCCLPHSLTTYYWLIIGLVYHIVFGENHVERLAFHWTDWPRGEPQQGVEGSATLKASPKKNNRKAQLFAAYTRYIQLYPAIFRQYLQLLLAFDDLGRGLVTWRPATPRKPGKSWSNRAMAYLKIICTIHGGFTSSLTVSMGQSNRTSSHNPLRSAQELQWASIRWLKTHCQEVQLTNYKWIDLQIYIQEAILYIFKI